MKNSGFENYADFRKSTLTKVSKTEAAELTKLDKAIETLKQQKDYSSLHIINELAAVLADAPEEEEAKNMQGYIYFILLKLSAKKHAARTMRFLSALVSEML